MPLDDLPLVVVDQILELVDISELLALSSTCKSLHPDANRFLYRKANDIATTLDTQKPGKWDYRHYEHPHFKKLEDSLALNPRNAQYIRKYTAISLKSLRTLWSQVPLNLTCLNIVNGQSWFLSNNHQFTRALSELHPDTIIKEISVDNFHFNDGDDVYRVFPKTLHQFRGLRKFTITLRRPDFMFVFPSVFHIFAYVECPGLEHLVIQGNGAEGIAYPDETLPNLSFLEILPGIEWTDTGTNPSKRFEYSDEDDFKSLKILMKKGISFRYGYRLDVLAEFISNGIEDDTPLIKWLLKSECRLQRANSGNDSITLDLYKFKPYIRDKVFRIIPSLRLPRDVKLIISMNTHDAPPPWHFLAEHVQHLAVRLGDIDKSLIEDILASIPKLESLSIATTISNKIFNIRYKFPVSVLFNDVHRNPLVYKLSPKNRWDAAYIGNRNLLWGPIKEPVPTMTLMMLNRTYKSFFDCLEAKNVCFYFMTGPFPVPWFT